MFWRKKEIPPTRIYLDHAAATPLLPVVAAVMKPYFDTFFGNASAIHTEGRLVRQAVEEARQRVATTLGVRKEGVFFTGHGTEANNLALLGHLHYLHVKEKRPYTTMQMVISPIEHSSISEVEKEARRLGVDVVRAPVCLEGILAPHVLRSVLTPKTVLVSVGYVNSEIGTIQPIGKLARAIRDYERQEGISIVFHTDAAQAPLWLPCQLPALGAELMTLDAGKCGGPKGVGILVRHGEAPLRAVIFGGGQEDNLRPGTENAAAIVGAAEAIAYAQAGWQKRALSVQTVRDYALKKIAEVLPRAQVNGVEGDDRVANNINISLVGYDTEYAVVYLDTHGVAVSTKSACAGAGSGESAVVKAMTGDAARSRATLRLTLGEQTTTADIDTALAHLVRFCSTMKM